MTEITLDRDRLPDGSRVLCAVSGGADSVCLLELMRHTPGIECICAHYDHGIRGEDSRRDAEFVAELCRKWGIPFVTERGDVPAFAKAHGMGLEEAARTLRYDFLRRAAEECRADCIATAHNRNDNAETVLLAMARGTGLKGLCGIPPERDGIVRPLLHVSRREIEAYLTERNIPWVEDVTNRTDDCARNRARHHVLPAMETLHDGAVENIARMTETLREDEEYLSSLADAFLAGQEGETLSVSGLLALPRPVAARAVRKWLGRELSREHLESVLSLCRGRPSAETDIPGGTVRREYDRLHRGEAAYEPLKERELCPGATLQLESWEINCDFSAQTGEIQSSFNTFFFSYANICGKLTVTPRRSGDTIRLRGREGTRTLKKLMIENRIPAARRENVPVIRDEMGVLAAYGIGQAERAFPEPGESALRITIREKNKGEKE